MQNLWSVLLTTALLFPSVSQLAHQLEGHEHVVCEDFRVHLHQSEWECPIQDFQLSSFDRIETPVQLDEPTELVTTPAIHRAGTVTSRAHFFYQMRGPPQGS